MAPKIINLTLLVATEEVESFLEAHPEYVCQTFLSTPEISQKLIDYVTVRSRDRYIAINHTEEASGKFDFPYGPLKQRLHMEILIYKGILHITRNASLSENAIITERDLVVNAFLKKTAFHWLIMPFFDVITSPTTPRSLMRNHSSKTLCSTAL